MKCVVQGVVACALTAVLCGCGSSPLYRVERPEALMDLQAEPAGEVLFVLTAASEQRLADGSRRQTGFFLGEFYEPYKALTDAGYTVAVATADGAAPVVDPESLKVDYWKDNPEDLKEAQRVIDQILSSKAWMGIAEANGQWRRFQAVVVPGGQGVMEDLVDNRQLHELVAQMGAEDRPVGLICHAPAVLLRMAPQDNPFVGRRVTSVSGTEEWYIETFIMDAEARLRMIGPQLDEQGFKHESAFPGRGHAVRDCNLVTSQNPFSGAQFNALFLEALEDWRSGGRCVLSDEDAS